MIDKIAVSTNETDNRPTYEAPQLSVLDANKTEGGTFTFTNETTNGTTS